MIERMGADVNGERSSVHTKVKSEQRRRYLLRLIHNKRIRYVAKRTDPGTDFRCAKHAPRLSTTRSRPWILEAPSGLGSGLDWMISVRAACFVFGSSIPIDKELARLGLFGRFYVAVVSALDRASGGPRACSCSRTLILLRNSRTPFHPTHNFEPGAAPSPPSPLSSLITLAQLMRQRATFSLIIFVQV